MILVLMYIIQEIIVSAEGSKGAIFCPFVNLN